MEKYFLIGAVLVATTGAVCDVRSARIPNWLTYSSLAAALALRLVASGWAGLKGGLVGVLVAGGIFLVLFLMGAMGGGDLKLMASVGAWVGSGQVVTMLLAAAFAGGFLALVHVAFGRRGRQTLWNLLELIRFRLTSAPSAVECSRVGRGASAVWRGDRHGHSVLRRQRNLAEVILRILGEFYLHS